MCSGHRHGWIENRLPMKKLLVVVLLLAALFVAGVPVAAYLAGMDNMDDRPPPPERITYREYQAMVVWEERKELPPIALQAITPWHFYALIWCSRYNDDIEDFLTCGDRYPGLRAAAYVAKRHLDDHLKQRGLIWRYMSRAALTIWISRNWTAEQLVRELVRLKSLPPSA